MVPLLCHFLFDVLWYVQFIIYVDIQMHLKWNYVVNYAYPAASCVHLPLKRLVTKIVRYPCYCLPLNNAVNRLAFVLVLPCCHCSRCQLLGARPSTMPWFMADHAPHHGTFVSSASHHSSSLWSYRTSQNLAAFYNGWSGVEEFSSLLITQLSSKVLFPSSMCFSQSIAHCG